MEETLDFESPKTGIPTFLKVLCILTFVGAGLTIVFSAFFVVQLQMTLKMFENMNSGVGNSPFDIGNSLSVIFKWSILSYILNGIGAIVGLAGAIFMWKLKKIGFFIYLLGQIIPIIGVVLVYIGSSKIPYGTTMAMGTLIFGAFYFVLSVAFLIMYGVNFKQLKK